MAIINQEKIDQLLSTENLPFEQAMFLLRSGKKVYRAGWKNIRYIEMQKPDEFSKMRKAYLFAIPLDNQAVPFAPSNEDLFAEDWLAYK